MATKEEEEDTGFVGRDMVVGAMAEEDLVVGISVEGEQGLVASAEEVS